MKLYSLNTAVINLLYPASTPFSKRALDNAVLLGEIKQFYAASGHIYGSPRIYRDCKASALACSEHRVAKLMHQAKLFAVRGYRRVRYRQACDCCTQPIAPSICGNHARRGMGHRHYTNLYPQIGRAHV